jgi:hypothetical protein
MSMAQFSALVMTSVIRLIEMNWVGLMLWPEAF